MPKTLDQLIQDKITAITKEAAYVNWLSSIKTVAEDDIVILNNSFIYRDVSTSKNDKYLAFTLYGDRKIKEYYVVSEQSINLNFKHVSNRTPIPKTKLSDAIKIEKKTLGNLLYVLIGVIEDNIEIEQELNSSVIKKIVLNPSLKKIKIVGDEVHINDTVDEDSIWSEIQKYYNSDSGFISTEEQLKISVGSAIDILESQSYSLLKVPEKIKKGQKNVTESLAEMLDIQIKEYQAALAKCKGDPTTDKNAFNEVLRIAYNYSSDALTFVRLIVSVCDLKPLALWMTIEEHYRLSESFKNLPWLRSKRKPSLKNYKGIIGGARNSAFHNLFPFKRSIDIQIPDKSLMQITLRTFSEYTKKKENQLRFQDKELVDVLTEFTRTNEHKISPSFWQKNLEVLIATKVLFEQTANSLKQLYKS